ncbi:Methyltransferase type 11 [Anaeromyxobacter sp. K]|uniref:class I SAM-dependent methyltransferase n=1 Tax=Anaeromyxobacter sp. (strain K) TaxID=447217 RepID=UPI00015F8472|nr:class I SAM-dependent methyltransferase [Anaeromyxobacter sp. K]ACG74374.1 Methyltransferase type 11 [Anaeromyxobacter sp. K]
MTETAERTFQEVFTRCHAHGRRWDEGLWRYFEVLAVKRLLAEDARLARGPILDVGCGDGELFGWVFGRRRDAVGVDSCDTWDDDVASARERGIYGEVSKEDARALSFPDGRFALVFSNSVVEHVDGVEQLIAEAHRVLRPGGALIFTTPDPRLYEAPAYEWSRVLAPLGLGALGRVMARRECREYRHVSMHGSEEWGVMLESAGLERVHVRTYMPLSAARAMTRFSGPSRMPCLRKLASLTSAEARQLSSTRGSGRDEWVARARRVLDPLLREEVPEGGAGLGLLLVARKAGAAQ